MHSQEGQSKTHDQQTIRRGEADRRQEREEADHHQDTYHCQDYHAKSSLPP